MDHDGGYSWGTSLPQNAIAIPIAAHSSNQVQPRDMCVFGLTRRLIRRLNKLGDADV
jgi:hypothetical protein